MNRPYFLCFLIFLLSSAVAAQQSKPAAPRRITLDEAVQMALKHNHVVRLAQYRVDEKQQAKRVARSSYFPLVRNDSAVAQLTDTQFIDIPKGSLGLVAGTPIPEESAILNQGERTIITSGTQLTQPLSELFKVRAANDVAAAELSATKNEARQTENEIALHVHQLYYRILIVQTQHEAAQAKLTSADDLNNERVVQVRLGSSLEEQALESRAQSLEAKQDLLTTELQLSDLTMQLNDAIGLPLNTPLALEPGVREVKDVCASEECVRAALATHPEVAKARAEVEKAASAVRLAKREYIPDVEAFARYSYQDNVPFLARNFGTFGVHVGYDLFDGGRRNAEIAEHQAQLSQAKENLARVTEEVELRVQTAHNKLERTQQMVQVSEQLLALRTESHRVSVQQLQQGTALRSQTDQAEAQELQAKALLLQSQLDYVQAHDEFVEAMGEMPDAQ
ncbi:MAG TPA: TolC family protein [Candidatus Sulfotelmatobacter sp.]|nr:TolC family protein [Candidatus Sulfotelmatobacter sp.]